jgi:hypothetical protein
MALAFILLFAATDIYAVALMGILLAGAGTAGFGTMQAVLVMISAGPDMRGRALGMLSTAIGALPFSMVLLGGAAQLVGPPAALAGSALLGLVSMTFWTVRRPESARLR